MSLHVSSHMSKHFSFFKCFLFFSCLNGFWFACCTCVYLSICTDVSQTLSNISYTCVNLFLFQKNLKYNFFLQTPNRKTHGSHVFASEHKFMNSKNKKIFIYVISWLQLQIAFTFHFLVVLSCVGRGDARCAGVQRVHSWHHVWTRTLPRQPRFVVELFRFTTGEFSLLRFGRSTVTNRTITYCRAGTGRFRKARSSSARVRSIHEKVKFSARVRQCQEGHHSKTRRFARRSQSV